ncbi:hypothetical protein [Kribbella sp. NPDC000426]|uniref:hypothetical protein n=1 Tax=Kribbella sp. NPDC000426 TaxID=3154255 RepID=UPI0033328DC1
MRWQVFGGERIGLGQCTDHADLRGLQPSELLFRIIGGASNRWPRERMPSLQGFAHALRNSGHTTLAINYTEISRLLDAEAPTMQKNKAAGIAFSRAQADWKRQLGMVAARSEEGAQLVERLKALVVANSPRFGEEIAASLELAEYKAAIDRAGKTRPALLFVKVPEHLRGRFIGTGGQSIRLYTQQLGVQVQIEGGKR